MGQGKTKPPLDGLPMYLVPVVRFGGGTLLVFALLLIFTLPWIAGWIPSTQATPDLDPSKTAASVWENSQISLYDVVERYEYHIRRLETGEFRTTNRIQDLRFHFDPLGFSLSPRKGASEWTMRFELEGVGRADELVRPSTDPVMDLRGPELVMDHGPYSVRYLNDRSGMRQDFLIHERPAGDTPLEVRMLLSGTLVASGTAPDEILFSHRQTVTGGERSVFRYDGLVAWDADGDTLPSAMQIQGTDLIITIEDRNATYPITIDPLSSNADALLEMDQASAMFGAATATAGDVNGDGYSDVIIGAPEFDNGTGNEGAAFVFLGSITGIGTTAAWTQLGTQPGARTGSAVSTAGDVNGDGFSDVLISEAMWTNPQLNEGRVRLFLGSSSGLGAASWSTEGNQIGARFGASVATAGDVNADGYSDVIIGAPFFDNGQLNEGQVFVYHGSALGLSPSVNSILQRDQADASFGASVSAAGDVNRDGFSDVIIGAPLFDNTRVDEGAVFVYHGSATGLPTLPNASRYRAQAGAQFGLSVSFAGDVNGDGFGDVIMGSPLYSGALSQQGIALVYKGTATGIGTVPSWTNSGGQTGAQLGMSVAGLGDINGDGHADVAVGAPFYTNGQTGEGLVRVFNGVSSLAGLGLSPSWSKESDQAGANLGSWVAPAGDVNGDGIADLAVAAPLFDHGEVDEGMVFIFHGLIAAPATLAAWNVESDQVNAYMGSCVSRAGDVNGDGYSDFVVGVPLYTNGQLREGRAMLYLGSPTGASTTPSWSVESDQVDARYGHCVTTAGDVNGDGYGDLIVGSPFYSNGQTEEGRAFLYLGSATGLSTTPAWTFESNQTGARLGWSVSSAGDVNGDGYGDVVIGAYLYAAPLAAEGRCYLFLGSSSGLSIAPDWTYDSGQANAFMGLSVSLAGDVNGDGYDDVIIGAELYDNTFSTEGAAFLFYGTPIGLQATPNWVIHGGYWVAHLGNSVGHAGDLDGDGYSDVFIAAYKGYDGETEEGTVQIHYGSPTGLAALPDVVLQVNQVGALFGMQAAHAGDLNGDGYSDLIVGAPRHSTGYLNEGRAFVYLGSPSGIATTAAWSVAGGATGYELGTSVCGAGDVNADGFSDLLVGTLNYANGQAAEGRASLYFGNAGPGIPRRSRQYREDLITPVQVGNKTFNSSCGWGIGLFAKSPLGRTRTKLAWEVKGHGPPFSGVPITSGMGITGISASWTDDNGTGIEIQELLSTFLVTTSHPTWRTRPKYHPATMINGQPFGPWYHGGIHDDQVPSLKVDLDLCGLLPIELISAQGSCSNGTRSVEWITGSEWDVLGFHISSSSNGNDWDRVGTIEAHGGYIPTTYHWTEHKANASTSYFRIETESFSGLIEVVRILSIAPCDGHGVNEPFVYPNPACDGWTTLTWAGFAKGGCVIKLMDSGGKEIARFDRSDELSDRATLDLGTIAKGTYVLLIQDQNGVNVTADRLMVL
jgi:hypothetical protein